MIDNVPILQLDIVWCYFMLQDISCLAVAGIRLENARKGFERSHGKDSTRLRLLQAGYRAELATYGSFLAHVLCLLHLSMVSLEFSPIKSHLFCDFLRQISETRALGRGGGLS